VSKIIRATAGTIRTTPAPSRTWKINATPKIIASPGANPYRFDVTETRGNTARGKYTFEARPLPEVIDVAPLLIPVTKKVQGTTPEKTKVG
jgi:hypothetical protein